MIAAVVLALALVGAGWAWTPDLDRATLDASYLAAPTDRVEIAGTQLHLRDSGPRDALAIVLLHGFGGSLHTWEPWALALQDRYRVVRFDLPGSGLSPPDPTGDYTDERSRALLAAVLDHLGLAQATLVGHSMGGRIAWQFAAREPQRVRALVLVAPDGFASPGFEYGKTPEVPAMLTLMRWALPEPLLRRALRPAYANPATMTDALSRRYHDLLRAPGAREAMLARMRQLTPENPLPWLTRISVPTLLLWGEQDAMIPLSNAADYTAAIAGARLETLAGIGHVPHEEAPARALVPVRAFLDATVAP
jgi:pimeloyl-ACP methyl ester carboxylesterase